MPGTTLYYYAYVKGQLVLRCCRGSSALEGYHKHLARCVEATSINPARLADIQANFNFRWNVRSLAAAASEFFNGHFNFSLLEETQDAARACGHTVYPNLRRSHWFQESNEQFYFVARQEQETFKGTRKLPLSATKSTILLDKRKQGSRPIHNNEI